MKKWLVITALLVVLSIALSGCTSYLPIPEDYSLPVEGAEEIYDDVVPTPGGAAYRANVHQVGKENPWPSVETVVIELNGGWLRYRDRIETGVGETRNNIFTLCREGGFWYDHFHLGKPGGFWQACLELYVVSIPEGIELSQYMSGGLPGTLATVLIIEIAPGIAPGRYDLEIGIKVKGRHYGTVPCIIQVVE
jgi:hypothetical protein